MSAAKILIIMVVMNICLYLGGVTIFDNDIIDRFVNVNEGAETVTSYSVLSDTLPLDAEASTNNLYSDNSGFSFFDALNLIWDVVKFLLNIVFAPIGLLLATGMPLVVQLMMGLPLGLMYIYGLISLIRGVS